MAPQAWEHRRILPSVAWSTEHNSNAPNTLKKKTPTAPCPKSFCSHFGAFVACRAAHSSATATRIQVLELQSHHSFLAHFWRVCRNVGRNSHFMFTLGNLEPQAQLPCFCQRFSNCCKKRNARLGTINAKWQPKHGENLIRFSSVCRNMGINPHFCYAQESQSHLPIWNHRHNSRDSASDSAIDAKSAMRAWIPLMLNGSPNTVQICWVCRNMGRNPYFAMPKSPIHNGNLELQAQ